MLLLDEQMNEIRPIRRDFYANRIVSFKIAMDASATGDLLTFEGVLSDHSHAL